jgi:hypothetical protein
LQAHEGLHGRFAAVDRFEATLEEFARRVGGRGEVGAGGGEIEIGGGAGIVGDGAIPRFE